MTGQAPRNAQWARRGVAVLLAGLLANGTLLANAAGMRQDQHRTTSGTLVLRGSMSSTATLAMSGAFSVGRASNLSWDLPTPISQELDGYSEQVVSVRYAFSQTPDSSRTVTIDGQPFRRFHWTAPATNRTITVVETLQVVVRSNLSPFQSNARYPLTGISTSISPYLANTSFTQLPSSAHALLQRLMDGKTTEQSVVEAAADWVASTTHYIHSWLSYPHSAAWAIAHHWATCQGYANLMAGMLRSLGIPVRVEYGWISAGPLALPGPAHGTSFIQWAKVGSQGEPHAWLSVYFPDRGWVPFDPLREKFFVDPRHIGFLHGVDASSAVLGAWTAASPEGQSATGPKLGNGAVLLPPGSSTASTVSVQSQDVLHVTLQRIRHDVGNVVLFSR